MLQVIYRGLLCQAPNNNADRQMEQQKVRRSYIGHQAMEAESPRFNPTSGDIFAELLECPSDRHPVEDSPMAQNSQRPKKLQNFLKSSSSNENLMMPELRNDSSMDIEEGGREKNFETENSQDDESVRHFKKRAEQSFSVERTSKWEDSSSRSFSQRSDSQSHHNAGDVLNAMEEESEEPKKVFQGCFCKKSKCIKLYCQCFHLGLYCKQTCRCLDCANRQNNAQQHHKAVIAALARNPKAFQALPDPQQNPERQAMNFDLGVEKEEIKRGCKCRKTKCQKKYCECYNKGEYCSIFCRCQDCINKKQFQQGPRKSVPLQPMGSMSVPKMPSLL